MERTDAGGGSTARSRCAARRGRQRPAARGAGAVLARAVAVAALFAASLGAQPFTFRSGIETVLVTVTVTDENGRLVTGLSRRDFEVFENGEPQPITQFTDQRVPVSLGVLLDVSDSMRGQPMADARAAVERFLADLLRPEDEAFIAAFNHRPRVVAPWTRPPATLRASLGGLRPGGATALYDALVAAAPLFAARRHARSALVVISDGADTASDRSLQEARQVIRRTDPFVYAIAIDSGEGPASTRVNPEALREITGPSGGYTEVVRSAEDLGPATERIAYELNHQYTIGYAPLRAPDGRWRSIRVRTRDGRRLVRARRGYLATRP